MAKRVILDTNLCILLCVGMTDIRYIGRHKRLQMFDEHDFDLLNQYLTFFERIVFLPNIATETSNLLRHVAEPIRTRCSLVLAKLIGGADERYVRSKDAMNRAEYARLGVADCALLETVGDGDQLLTEDFDLYYAAAEAGLEVINFNHLRDGGRDTRF